MLWLSIVSHLPKNARYTLGVRIENRFLDLLELSYQTYFTERDRKSEKIAGCILLLDTIKFLVSTAWEGNSSPTVVTKSWRSSWRRSARCLAAGKRVCKTRTRKTAIFSRGKENVAKTEDKLVVRIPPVVRLGPVVVEPQTVVIAFEVEDVRVAVPVCECAPCRPSHCPRKSDQVGKRFARVGWLISHCVLNRAVSNVGSQIHQHVAPRFSFLMRRTDSSSTASRNRRYSQRNRCRIGFEKP